MIIGLSGYAQTGKDTVAQHLVSEYGFTRIAFADPIRDALYALNPFITDIPELSHMRLQWLVDKMGWEFLKQDSNQVRELLQRMGTEVARNQWGQDFWVDLAMNKASSLANVVITDVRFPNEYDAIIANGGQVWRVSRPGVTAVNGHASETSLDGYTFARNVLNNGYKQDLYATVDYYMQH
jgi:hypothetical protein